MAMQENLHGSSSLYDVNKALKEFWPKQRTKIREMDLVSFTPMLCE